MKRAKLSFISLSAILIMIFVFTFPVSASEATQTATSQMNWMDKGWGQIHKGETFKPDANLTRGELVSLINSYSILKSKRKSASAMLSLNLHTTKKFQRHSEQDMFLEEKTTCLILKSKLQMLKPT